jgi:tRNA G18 (ribose-2'-O)-methylase SpoU
LVPQVRIIVDVRSIVDHRYDGSHTYPGTALRSQATLMRARRSGMIRAMDAEEIDRADDPRIADYVALSDPARRRRVEENDGFFIAEGPIVIRTLLTTSLRVRSVLVTPHQRAALADVLEAVTAPVYVVSPEVMRHTVGFDLHRGAVAAADRYPLPELETVIRGATRIAILERVNDHENLGALFRNAAAFGIDAVLLCPQCSDPLYRRSVRVSTGHVLTVPWTRATPWPAAIARLRELGFTVLALTPSRDAESIDTVSGTVLPAGNARIALLVGAEGPGLSREALAAASTRVRIPMAEGVDSLNVAVAAAVSFAHFARPGTLH